jgi:hypothetical protein
VGSIFFVRALQPMPPALLDGIVLVPCCVAAPGGGGVMVAHTRSLMPVHTLCQRQCHVTAAHLSMLTRGSTFSRAYHVGVGCVNEHSMLECPAGAHTSISGRRIHVLCAMLLRHPSVSTRDFAMPEAVSCYRLRLVVVVHRGSTLFRAYRAGVGCVYEHSVLECPAGAHTSISRQRIHVSCAMLARHPSVSTRVFAIHVFRCDLSTTGWHVFLR